MLKNTYKIFDISKAALNIYNLIFHEFKCIINQSNFDNIKIIRYAFKGEDNYIKLIYRTWNIEELKINSNIIKKMFEHNKRNECEELENNIELDSLKLKYLKTLISEYQSLLYEYDILNNNFNIKKYKLSSHLNYYPEEKLFKIPYNTYYSRMPFHIDTSEFTIIQQNQKGLKLKKFPRLLMNENKIIIFDSSLEHRVELFNKERFSLSTFMFLK